MKAADPAVVSWQVPQQPSAAGPDSEGHVPEPGDLPGQAHPGEHIGRNLLGVATCRCLHRL